LPRIADVLAGELSERARRVRLVCLDVDGVLTDGGLHYGVEGELFKGYHVRDGLGIRLLLHHGIHVAVISARASELVRRRMADLRIQHWLVGCEDKSRALDGILSQLALSAEQVAFMGDDLLDVPVMRRVGLAAAVQDAHPCTLEVAHVRTSAHGGRGAVRELADLVLDAQLGLTKAYEHFLAAVTSPRDAPA
jgi:3-deoxy-D-manno-octulosonate 8-phosphate phosphatase (KDO 8-P phosphatase)